MFGRAQRSGWAWLVLASALGAAIGGMAQAQTPPPAASPASASPVTSLSLDQAVRIALASNQTLRAQRLNIDQSRALEITAGLKPNPVLSLLSEDYRVFAPSNLTFANFRDNQSMTDSVTYLIERGGKRRKRIAVAQDTTRSVLETVGDAERQIRFQVAQAFIGVLLANANLDFSRQTLKEYTQEVEINRQRLRAGDISNGDFLKLSLQQLQFEQDVKTAELALAQAKTTLRQLLGFHTVAERYDVDGSLDHKKRVFLLDELEKQAVASRPDLRAAEIGVKVADEGVTLAYGNRARDLTAEGEYTRSGPINGAGFGLSIELPVHDRNQGEIARTKFAATQSREVEAAARVSVLTDVINAFEAYRNSDQVVSMYENGYLEQSSKSREISLYSYHRGASTLLDLLDSERDYRAVQLAYRQALAAYDTSLEQINSAVGAQVIP
ncbi:MAG: TolC family protein [Bryobacteraceae bacterium]